jgi:hypothetical protein
MNRNRFLLIALCIYLFATTAMGVRLQEDGPPAGLVVMEAERFDALIPAPSGEFTWEFETGISGYSAEGYMRSRPEGTNVMSDLNRSARLDYVVKIKDPGTLYIWARVLAPTSAENSIHLGDSGAVTADRINVPEINQWVWKNVANDGSRAMVAVNAPGLVTIHCWMRESGCCVDKLLLTSDESYVPDGGGPPESPDDAAGKVTSPSPASETTDVVRDTVLSWSPGEFAVTHNVYLGLDFDAVNDADEGSALLVGPGLTGTTFTPEAPLTYAATYYWRVDALNSANPNSPWKGEVWQFEVEPYVYPIAPIGVTASSSHKPEMGPDKTIDGSGLDDSDSHGTDGFDMWLSAMGDTERWIQYEFDRPCKLHEMWVWNQNQLPEPMVGFGAKVVAVEISVDGDTWTALADVPQFEQAPGEDGYAHSTVVDFGHQVAKFVKLTVESGWGQLAQSGLSEVRFFYLPTYARDPRPADGAREVAPDVVLSWRSGREAARHEVYVGEGADSLVLAGTSDQAAFGTQDIDLQLGQTYSWVVTEVNDAATPTAWEGEVWALSVVEPLVLDDMESYRDKEGLEIWATWLDGTEFGTDDPANGSIVGANPLQNDFRPATGLGRGQSLPIWFDNTTASYSEATRFVDNEDWTRHGIESLSLYFRKGAGNTGGGQVYVKINDKQVVYEDPADVPPGWQTDQWIQWIIDLSTVGANLTRVTEIMVGVKGANARGVLYVDDIALYKDTPTSEQVVSWFEAESGTRGLTMLLFEDLGGSLGASGGQFIGTEDGSGEDTGVIQMDGIATYRFSVHQAGIYKLMARVGDFGGNSFHVRIPGSDFNTTGFQDGWISWNFDSPDELGWRTLADYNDGNQEVEFTLPAGEQTLEIARREDGAFLDVIAIVSVTE